MFLVYFTEILDFEVMKNRIDLTLASLVCTNLAFPLVEGVCFVAD